MANRILLAGFEARVRFEFQSRVTKAVEVRDGHLLATPVRTFAGEEDSVTTEYRVFSSEKRGIAGSDAVLLEGKFSLFAPKSGRPVVAEHHKTGGDGTRLIAQQWDDFIGDVMGIIGDEEGGK